MNQIKNNRGLHRQGNNIYWIENGNAEYLYPVGYVYEPSSSCLDNIKKFEGWHEGWKKCPNGHPTTGWGFKQTPLLKKKYPRGMTKEQADAYFIDVAVPERVTEFRKCMKDMMFYNQNQLDALFDLVYNIGISGFKDKSPNLQKALKTRNIENILKEMNHGENDTNAPGLKNRRNKERVLFMTPVKPPQKLTKRTISLRESDLRNIIKESVRLILEEKNSLVNDKFGDYEVVYGNLFRQKLHDCPEMGGVEDVCLYSNVKNGGKTYALYRIYNSHKYFFTEWIPLQNSNKTVSKKIKIKEVPKSILNHAHSLIHWD